jgi:hypothetical protein
MTDRSNRLNSNHERRLSVTCRHIDKLLGEMENALNISASKLAFPQYALDLGAEQSQAIEEFIGQIRAQLVKVLDGQDIAHPPADVPVSRTLLSHLTFIDIAAEELRPRYMRGYGEISLEAAEELDKIATDLLQLTRQFHHYLAGCATEIERNKATC